MAVDLSEYVDSLRREITPVDGPAPFIQDQVLVGYLVDAFWDARLDGFLKDYSADEDGIVTHNSGSDRELPREGVALCVIYAGARILRLQLINTEAHFRATAGPVEFETRSSANVMQEMLQQLQWRKERLLEALERTDVAVLDALTTRTLSPGSYGGWVGPPVYAGDQVMP